MLIHSKPDADRSFIPLDFEVPLAHEWQGCKLVPLSASLAPADFAAVSGSARQIRHVFGPTNGWPAAELTAVENEADILRHEAEFASRRAFTYAILDQDSGEYVGCLYIKRIKSHKTTDYRKRVFDGQAFFWLSVNAYTVAREAETYHQLGVWLATSWPFQSLAWPGRSVSWDEWMAAEISEEVAQAVAASVVLRTSG